MSLAPLPVHALDASERYLVALTGANLVLYERASGKLLAALDARIDAGSPGDATVAAFPRLCALSPSETFVAVTSDDKTLRVWRTTDMARDKEVVRQRLAKRAGTLQWTHYDLNGTLGEEVVVADKFGDVWSWPVDASVAPAALPDAAEEDPAEAVVKPRLGHVSMVTCLAFLGAPLPQQIVSADRDEHIRLSRWGPRRAGHIVTQYLLGSSSFVGALLPLAAADARAAHLAERDTLVSADGGHLLRVWTQAEDGSYGPQSVVTLDAAALRKYVSVDADVERRRERAASNLGLRDAFDPTAKPPPKRKRTDGEEGEEAMDPAPLVLTHLLRVADDQVLLTWEGASVLALVPLAELATTHTLDNVYLYDVHAPILSVAYVAAAHTLYVATDDRPGMAEGPALRAFTVDAQQLTPCELPGEALAQLAGTAPVADAPTEAPPLAKHAVLTAAAHTPRAYGTWKDSRSAARLAVEAVPVSCADDVAQAAERRGRYDAVPQLFPRPAPRGGRQGDGAALPVGQACGRARQEPGGDPAAVCRVVGTRTAARRLPGMGVLLQRT